MLEIIFLGTNGWYDTKTGNTISVLIKTPFYYIVLDAGNGIAKLDKYIKEDKPVYLFISHLHIDHICGLHTLVKFKLRGGLNIIIHEDMITKLKEFVGIPFSLPFEKLNYKTEIMGIPDCLAKLPFRAEALPLVHQGLSVGFRMEIGEKVITYCPDTGYCENALKLAEHADVLIAECAFKPGQINPDWPHLNPELGAKIAKESGAKKLILTHFDAWNYPDLNSRKIAQNKARKVFKNAYLSNDGMTFSV